MKHLHNFSEPVDPTTPSVRKCADCDEPQVYKAPTGQGRGFPDVLVDKEDLRLLLTYVDDALSEHGIDPETDETYVRVRNLLTPPVVSG